MELCPFYTDDTQLNILYGFDTEGQARMKGLMKSFHVWKMTVAEEKKEVNLQTANGLDIRYQHSGDALQVSLKGRLDTLSAPELMELFDKLCADTSFTKLVFDLESWSTCLPPVCVFS